MTVLHRALRPGAAAVLVSAALVSAALVSALAAAAVTPARAATAAPTHVAVVVDGVGSACVPWHAGMTGADVLGARFDVQYGQPTPRGNFAGMVVQIDGVPANPDPNTAYWAYFHDTGSGWAYSNTGALSFKPQPGTVDGWRLDSAAAQNSHPAPAPASYASICAGQDRTAAPTHATATKTKQPARTSAAAPPPATSTAPPAAAAGGARHPATGGTARGSGRATSGATSTTAGPNAAPNAVSSAAPGLSSTPSPGLSPALSSTRSAAPAAQTRTGSAGLPTWGAGAGALVVLALAGGALWRARAGRDRS